MPAFPAYGKLLFDAEAARKPAPAIDRTDMERGPPKHYLRTSKAMVTIRVRYLFTSKADFNNFMTWFHNTIGKGRDWFDWTDPLDATVKLARIAGGAIEPKATRKDLERWIVAFELEFWGA